MTRQRNERYEKQAKKSLLTYTEKQVETLMIGALAAFETHFGFIWGHGKEYNMLTPAEKDMREKWQITRTRILDLGNSRISNIREEFEYFLIENVNFTYTFNLKKD